MSVSSQSDAETCLLERRYLTIKARLAQKFFWDMEPRKGYWRRTSLCQQFRQHLAAGRHLSEL
jgi:hypothetical protein